MVTVAAVKLGEHYGGMNLVVEGSKKNGVVATSTEGHHHVAIVCEKSMCKVVGTVGTYVGHFRHGQPVEKKHLFSAEKGGEAKIKVEAGDLLIAAVGQFDSLTKLFSEQCKFAAFTSEKDAVESNKRRITKLTTENMYEVIAFPIKEDEEDVKKRERQEEKKRVKAKVAGLSSSKKSRRPSKALNFFSVKTLTSAVPGGYINKDKRSIRVGGNGGAASASAKLNKQGILKLSYMGGAIALILRKGEVINAANLPYPTNEAIYSSTSGLKEAKEVPVQDDLVVIICPVGKVGPKVTVDDIAKLGSPEEIIGYLEEESNDTLLVVATRLQ